MNIHAFSVYKWCIQGATEGQNHVQQAEEVQMMLQAVGKYCLRLLEQCERSKCTETLNTAYRLNNPQTAATYIDAGLMDCS